MLNITATVKVDLSAFKKLNAELDKAIKIGLQKGAYEVERKAKQYAPYDTGTLIRSITTYPVKKNLDGWSVIITPTVFYGAFMEQPGRVLRRGRRPYMKPALLESVDKIKLHLTNEIRRILR